MPVPLLHPWGPQRHCHRDCLGSHKTMVKSYVVLFSWSWTVAMIIMSTACLHSDSVLRLLNSLLLVLLIHENRGQVFCGARSLGPGLWHDQNVRCLLHSDSALKFPNTCFWLATVDLHRVLLVQWLMTSHGNARVFEDHSDSSFELEPKWQWMTCIHVTVITMLVCVTTITKYAMCRRAIRRPEGGRGA